MIVAPDFFDHWRTRMLVDALGADEMAPLYVQRIWAHCQVRKGVCFTMPAAGLKALCKFAGDAALLEQSLIAAGFVARNCAEIEVLKWAEYNSQLIAAWRNGKAGGRPKGSAKAAEENPPVSGGMPDGSQQATQAKAIGQDEIGQEINTPLPSGSGSSESSDSAPRRPPVNVPDCPHQRILALWAEVLPSLPQHNPKRWDGAKADALRARWKELAVEKGGWPDQETGLRRFRSLFEYIAKSDFLMGRKDPAPGRQRMEATLEWLCTRSKWDRVVEGKYHDAPPDDDAAALPQGSPPGYADLTQRLDAQTARTHSLPPPAILERMQRGRAAKAAAEAE